MGDLPDEVKRAVWRRDGYRCKECGFAVDSKNGCQPQTHHVAPKSLGGSDDPSNLITLCLVPFETPEKLEEIVRGFKISYWSRHSQSYFDDQVRGEIPTA